MEQKEVISIKEAEDRLNSVLKTLESATGFGINANEVAGPCRSIYNGGKIAGGSTSDASKQYINRAIASFLASHEDEIISHAIDLVKEDLTK